MPIIAAKYKNKIKETTDLEVDETEIKYIKTFQLSKKNWILKEKMLNPILKWVGGKSQILGKVFSYFPKTINNYYEPFVGGGSVFLELIKRVENGTIKITGSINVNDINTDLINLYTEIKDNPKRLIKHLKIYHNNYNNAKMPVDEYKLDDDGEPIIKKGKHIKTRVDTKKMLGIELDTSITKGKDWLYYHYREDYNKKENYKYDKVALLLFLNKTCWRGVHREGPYGFNVPFGNYATPSIFNKKQIMLLSCYFKKYNVQFTNMDFKKFCKSKKGKTDFVYMDPPYYPLNPSTSFTTYNKEGFGLAQHDNLFDICQKFKKGKTKFLHSNSCCEWNTEKYNGFEIDEIKCKRRINSKNPEDTVQELFIYF